MELNNKPFFTSFYARTLTKELFYQLKKMRAKSQTSLPWPQEKVLQYMSVHYRKKVSKITYILIVCIHVCKESGHIMALFDK